MKRVIKILSVVMCFSILFLVTGCGKKEITAEKFKSVAEEKSYLVRDDTDMYLRGSNLVKAYTAVKVDSSYSIEFYEFKDKTTAEGTFNKNVNLIKKDKNNGVTLESNLFGYSTYKYYSKDVFKYTARIGNTVIYVNTLGKYRTEIEKFIEKINY